jgi:hypothetical protein
MPPSDKLSKVLSFVQLGTSKMLIISIPNREWRAREDEDENSSQWRVVIKCCPK